MGEKKKEKPKIRNFELQNWLQLAGIGKTTGSTNEVAVKND